MKKQLFLILTLFGSSLLFSQVGINTDDPQKDLHVDGSLQVTKEINVGGSATQAGSAGTKGQVLTSQGPGNAPIWTDNGMYVLKNIYYEEVGPRELSPIAENSGVQEVVYLTKFVPIPNENNLIHVLYYGNAYLSRDDYNSNNPDNKLYTLYTVIQTGPGSSRIINERSSQIKLQRTPGKFEAGESTNYEFMLKDVPTGYLDFVVKTRRFDSSDGKGKVLLNRTYQATIDGPPGVIIKPGSFIIYHYEKVN